MSSFRRIITVMLENASRDTVLSNKYMCDLRKKGVFLSNSYSITHPSQPNYFTLTGGDTLGMVTDDPGWVQWDTVVSDESKPVTCIADLLDKKGMSWKAYAECLLPSDLIFCKPGEPLPPPETLSNGHFPFYRRHVPFLSYPHIMEREDYAKEHIVNAEKFEQDLQEGNLPHYSFYTPNLINDGHSLPSSTSSKGPKDNCGDTPDHYVAAHPINDSKQLENIAVFLQSFLSDDPVAKFPPETLIVITFDESYGAEVDYNIYTLLIGDMLQAGTVCYEPYNHYSLLRTIEDNFGLGTLGRNDAAAMPYWFVRRSPF